MNTGEGRLKSNLFRLILQKQAETGQRITHRDIATETGLNDHTVARWMSNKPITRVDENVVISLCRFLQCELGDLLYIDYSGDE